MHTDLLVPKAFHDFQHVNSFFPVLAYIIYLCVLLDFKLCKKTSSYFDDGGGHPSRCTWALGSPSWGRAHGWEGVDGRTWLGGQPVARVACLAGGHGHHSRRRHLRGGTVRGFGRCRQHRLRGVIAGTSPEGVSASLPHLCLCLCGRR